MRKIFRKFNSFEAIIIVFSIFFSIIIILSAPALFNYKKLQNKIENQIESNYKIKINNINGIKYRFFPSPHLLIDALILSSALTITVVLRAKGNAARKEKESK